jgi:hypothetical protein
MRTLPFGYRAKGGKTVADPAEQKALALIRRLRAKGQNLRDIEQALIDEGHKPRGGEQWDPHTIRRILAADRERR